MLSEIRRRLGFLSDVGLDYLTLDRLSSTLSGGEAQRINLATSLGSALVGTLYVLDEPSIGLHPRDNQRLIAILRQLRDQGNTVLVVEHDADMIAVADHVVDLGLGAGEHGGRVVYAGRSPGWRGAAVAHGEVPARRAARFRCRRTAPQGHAAAASGCVGAREHNLKDVDVEIPLNTLTCVTGVSGSGKSTLVHDVLYAALKRAKGDWDRKVGAHRRLEGAELVSDVVLVDQTPIGRTPRSNPVTYLKAFDPDPRAASPRPRTPQSRGLTASHFSFNVPGGRCEACQGEGEVRVEMQFLADVFVPCEQCDGKRFKPQVLEVRYRGKNVNQVLDLTVREALHVLQQRRRRCCGACRCSTRSASATCGSASRRPRCRAARRSASRLPRTCPRTAASGCSTSSTSRRPACTSTTSRSCSPAFRKLLEAGHTLLVIEHNLDVIKTADWIIDLGPEGGAAGGHVIAMGTPEQVAEVPASHTGRYLRPLLGPAVPA